VACVRYVRHSLARSVELLKKRAVRYPLTVAPVPAAGKRVGRVKSESSWKACSRASRSFFKSQKGQKKSKSTSSDTPKKQLCFASQRSLPSTQRVDVSSEVRQMYILPVLEVESILTSV
jgi:hypothetical protein